MSFLGARALFKLDCSSIENLHDLSSSRCEPDWVLSRFICLWGVVRKDLSHRKICYFEVCLLGWIDLGQSERLQFWVL